MNCRLLFGQTHPGLITIFLTYCPILYMYAFKPCAPPQSHLEHFTFVIFSFNLFSNVSIKMSFSDTHFLMMLRPSSKHKQFFSQFLFPAFEIVHYFSELALERINYLILLCQHTFYFINFLNFSLFS